MHLSSYLAPLFLLLSTSATASVIPKSALYTCNISPTHPASRLGASKCVQALQEEANEAGGPTGGNFTVQVGGEPARVSEYTWTTEQGEELLSFVEIEYLGNAGGEDGVVETQGTEEEGESEVVGVPRREVAGMLMGLIQGCSNQSCIELDCPVSGSVRILDGTVEVRLLGA